MTDNQERELKLRPRDPALLDSLAGISQLGPFSVTGRSRELQRNSFFDSASRALRKAQIGFRRRTIEGQRLATWTIKGEGSLARGVWSRTEIELHLESSTPPAVAIDALRQAARERGALALAEVLDEALSGGGAPLSEPFVETETDRTVLDLESAEHGWSVELALDRVRLLGHAYSEVETEAELKHGDDNALEAVREAIAVLGPTDESEGSKLSRAIAHAERCRGCAPA